MTARAGRSAAAVFLLGIFLNAAAGVASVPLLADYPALTLTWLRYASMVLLFLPFAGAGGLPQGLAPGRAAWGLVPLGVVSLAALACFLHALKGIPVATVTGLFFCYPFLAVILSAALLGEAASVRDWMRVALGLCGVVVLLNPLAASPDAYALTALASGFFVAVKTVLTRRLGLVLPLVTVAAGEAAVAAVLLLPFVSVGPVLKLAQVGQLALYLALANAARLVLVLALRRGRVAGLAPLGYMELVFTAGLQVVLLSTVPTARDLLAFAVILAAGVPVGADKRKRAP